MAAEDWFDPTFDPPEREDLRRRVTRRAHGVEKIKQADLTQNKFYVGSRRALEISWGHPTLVKALKHAEELMESSDRDQFVVQIVRVVRRKKAPVEVSKV